MFLTLRKRLFALITIATISACATVNVPVGKSIVENNYWLTISESGTTFYSYAPYQTTIDDNENVTTLITGTSKNGGPFQVPSKYEVNCSGKMVKKYTVDPSGNWALYSDWSLPNPTSVDMQLVQRLCLIRAGDGNRQFINLVVDAQMPNKYHTFAWELNKNYSTQPSKYTVYKYFASTSTSAQLQYGYFFANCGNRKFATSDNLSSKDLEWKQESAPNTTFGFLMAKACGLKNLSPKTSQNKPESTNQNGSALADAKAKCSELGYKKGTEQFGTCVLKLSK